MIMRNDLIRILTVITLLIILALVPSSVIAAEKISFNFVDVDITAVAKFISDVTGKNFIYDNRVKGKVTVIAPTKISSSDAYDLFTSVLQLKGYAIVPSGFGAYKIIPVGEAKQSGLTVSERKIPKNDDFIARLILIENISADSALRFLQPLISRNGYISAFGPGNLILVMDSGLVIEKVLKIIVAIDKPFVTEEPEVVYLENSDAGEVARVLNEGVQKSAQIRGVKASAKAVPVKRINAIVLFGSKADRTSMLKLISRLDIEPLTEQGVINVYFLENADAEDLSTVIKNLITGGNKGPKGKGGTPSAQLSDINITPDKGTNSLVIVASPSNYSSLVNTIKQLDRKRRQVYVEALIVEASIDKLRELGTKWRAIGTVQGEPVAVGGFGVMDQNSMNEIVSGLSGLSVGGAGNYMNFQYPNPTNPGQMMDVGVPGFAALFSMKEFQGVVNILSSPQILTADNSEAEIHVGENVPFITKTETNTSGLATKSIERQDVGIKLNITPQITEGDNVRLALYQEISSVKDSGSSAALEVGPTTTIRSTKTTVIVSNEQTVVISGLMQERMEESETRVPLLHRIPLIGWLFKYRTSTNVKNNLLVFLTPHIIRDSNDLRRITNVKKDLYARKENMVVDGHMVVNFKEEVSEDTATALLSKKKLTIMERTKTDGYVVRLPEKMRQKKGFKLFKRVKEVESVKPFYRFNNALMPQN